jgi:hypothetical protein
VREVNMVGERVDSCPADRLPVVPVAGDFLHLGATRPYQAVTLVAGVYGRDAGLGGPSRADMAVLAGDSVFPSVDSVAKFDGLLGRFGLRPW